jgi:hypothetical protein
LRRLIRARRRTSDDSGVAGHTGEAIVPLAQDDFLALRIAALDASGIGHRRGSRGNRTRNLRLFRFARSTDIPVDIHLAAIGSVRQLRVNRALNEQQRCEKDQRQAVAVDVSRNEAIAEVSRLRTVSGTNPDAVRVIAEPQWPVIMMSEM